MKAEHSVEEVAGGYLLIKSASTGSISNAALASTLGEELLANRGQEVPPTSTTSRQPAKVVSQFVHVLRLVMQQVCTTLTQRFPL